MQVFLTVEHGKIEMLRLAVLDYTARAHLLVTWLVLHDCTQLFRGGMSWCQEGCIGKNLQPWPHAVLQANPFPDFGSCPSWWMSLRTSWPSVWAPSSSQRSGLLTLICETEGTGSLHYNSPRRLLGSLQLAHYCNPYTHPNWEGCLCHSPDSKEMAYLSPENSQ